MGLTGGEEEEEGMTSPSALHTAAGVGCVGLG